MQGPLKIEEVKKATDVNKLPSQLALKEGSKWTQIANPKIENE